MHRTIFGEVDHEIFNSYMQRWYLSKDSHFCSFGLLVLRWLCDENRVETS